MGEARRRGTFEQRKTEAEKRNAEEAVRISSERAALAQTRKRHGKSAAHYMYLAAAIGAGMSLSKTGGKQR